ncbi:hypothetical protein FACS189418_4910 [Clostridia bacterium]|nr:hypothetical protein FACS189418_4910 [Clostridia bacterium]
MGSVFFQIGQILVAMQLLHNTHLIFYLTFLLPTGMCAGLLVAYIVQPLLKKELLLCLFSSDPT